MPIMASVNNALSSLINGKKDFCCLCFRNVKEDPIHLNDEVAINTDHTLTIADVLSSVFNEETFNYITTFELLCSQCTKSAINWYTFLQTCHKNTEHFTKLIDSIANGVEFTSEELLQENKSLYISFSLEDFMTKQYYDMEHTPITKKNILRRFVTLDNQTDIDMSKKIKKEEVNSTDIKTKIKKDKHLVKLKTSDMLYDKNNQNVIQCKECLKQYPSIWNLRNHYIRVHAPKIYKCPECPRKYGSKAYLEAHKTDSHCTVVCSECGKTFNNKHTLKIHELGHHLTLVCEDCGRVYKNKTTFRKHKESNVCGQETRAHPSNAKFTCDYCNKKYTQKVSLRVHIQYEHGNYKAHICEWCGKKFWAPSRLKAHIVKHTKERNFDCTICGGKFVTKESLLYHTRNHTGENPYKCDYCDSRFPCSSRRLDHIRRQHIGATLECDICHIKFTSKRFLQNHKKTHTDKTEGTYETKKNITNKILNDVNIDKTKIIPNKSYKSTNKDIWKMESLNEITVSNNEFVQVTSDNDTQISKVYLEVPDDSNEY